MRISPIHIKNNFYFQKNINNKVNNNVFNNIISDNQSLDKMEPLFNISFGARPAPPVYLIDKDLNCTLFSKQSDLAKKLGVTPQRISGCINGRNPLIDGNVIVYHHQIEKKLDDGSSVIDKRKVAEIYNQRTQPKAVYAMDYMGELKRYSSIRQMETTKGLYIVSANEVESFDDEGQLILDKRKIAEGLLKSPNYSPIYSRDENGGLTKYENQSVFAQIYGVSQTAVGAAISGKIKTLCGFNIIPAICVETVTDNGEIVVDKRKMIDYLSMKNSAEKGVYTVTPSLHYKRYSSKKELAEQIGMNYFAMIKSAKGITPSGEYIVDASSIEEYDEDFKLVVNKSKLSKLIAEKLSEDVFYVIDMNMNIEKYRDLDSVAKALDRTPSTVKMTLWKPELHKSVADRVVVRAIEIEVIDENGNISIDRKKVSSLVQERLCKDSVYLIDKNGQCKKFRNRFSAASEYGCSASSSQNVRINGYLIVDASDIENINEDGTISLNSEKVKKLAMKSKNTF